MRSRDTPTLGSAPGSTLTHPEVPLCTAISSTFEIECDVNNLMFLPLFSKAGTSRILQDIPLSKPVDAGAQVTPSPALSGLAGSLVDEPNGCAPSSTEAEGRATWEYGLHKRHGPYLSTKTAPTGAVSYTHLTLPTNREV